ncbi:hypothetical protein GGD40_000270 [Paraburkholderia bryophila]|uniref:Transposase Tn5 dimerisation domain-containing protein n=1 Tax=Paraburkholderia bryophila TaxID=420952 RepID=A0A7Y9WIE9_9BURK|nr:hypothetical protein [Paraburkholderia bryophila]NYH20791.1 hypothetical protein [Paraburkholderia bryophila]
MWARERKGADGVRGGEKESTRWIEGYERVAEQAADLPGTRLVYVADRESDIIALMRRAHDLGCPADWLIRAQHNRVLPEGQRLWDHATQAEPLGEIRFMLHGRQRQKAREVFMVVAWRIARLMRFGRTCPDLDAGLLFEPDEWKAAFILNKKTPPDKPPQLNEVVRLVAMLGGFLARKGDGEPGVKTIWQGMQRVVDFAAGIRYMREVERQTCV